ncbi:nucleolar protein 8 [Anthonomus grandis grandis]|uniref:nucleolar protein 8 n=1 Tax=Anthonomus grandis grandis TaxID=2921223 RepID=UPI0021665396|nr:nucleolar protein 8 [Anthonomus grandis grandis]XP_050312447.1 nucleolar protein 8 [Anthonomus grandis grandis]XP_050312448.1 nucleolar protein 8 [Anthonomus grandis grandis]
MKPENKRIFISDLPETYTKEELESSFSKYGTVTSVEIKERKELTPKNTSLFFAFINLKTDELGLNQCFKDLSNKKWHGQFVQLQLARESFLERLKREREEAGQGPNNQTINTQNTVVQPGPIKLKKRPPASSSSGSESEPDAPKKPKTELKRTVSSSSSSESESEPDTPKKPETEPEKTDIIIKSNKSKVLAPGGLKIPSFGKAPIAEIPLKKPKVPQNDSEANKKRLQHLKEMKQSYESQKSLIRSALAYGSEKPSNKKILFEDEGLQNAPEKNGGLFDQEDSDFEPDFEVKEQFQGKKGQKLLELQSRYKNDKRFALDERFIEDEQGEEAAVEDDVEKEKQDQLKILNEVLGRTEAPVKRDSVAKKAMLKFDPTVPEHTNLELKMTEPEQKKRKKEKLKEAEEAKPAPEVSKEVFYKVPEKLKEALEEKQGFSLLSMFGQVKEEDKKEEEPTERELKRKPLLNGQNPFKYDSSDDEDEDIGDVPHKATGKIPEPVPVKALAQSVFWTEPFFFKNDDFRLQEGFDFIEKIRSEDKEFAKIRRDLKGIVRAKVRNNERKNKMFKKKLGGGNKRRKHVRMKKALKR